MSIGSLQFVVNRPRGPLGWWILVPILGAALATLWWSARGTQLSLKGLIDGLPWIGDFISRMLPPSFSFMQKLIRPAIDDCVAAGLLQESDDRVELSEQGREQFRAFVVELWGWLVTEVELANGEPLDEEGRDDLRTIARRQMLSDDPVTEPIELAQAGA